MEYISKPALIPDIANNFNLEEMSWEFLNSCDNSNFIFATADHPNPHLLPIVSIQVLDLFEKIALTALCSATNE